MSVARTWSVALAGVEGTMVEVEASQSNATPELRIIGLPDKALGEAGHRVRSACANRGLPLPRRKVTINLSPASLPKQGSAFDLAIAIAAVATELTMAAERLAETVHLGELGLDGRLRAVPGVLPAVVAAAAAGFRRVVVPVANVAEAELVAGIEVQGAATLSEVARSHGAIVDVDEPPAAPEAAPDEPAPPPPPDLAEVIGQREAVEALVTAAAGGHHLLMCGPPGAGKTMLAQRLPGILPDLDDAAALTAASIRSLTGVPVTSLERTPPFEAPHHSASIAALVGGGSRGVRPGAIVRASEGVLFLDEAGEFAASALDALRQPLESGRIVIHRAAGTAAFPARFQLVLATNPCPCGNHGIRGAVCECPPAAIRRYLNRLSGPLLDRIDIQLTMTRVVVADSRLLSPGPTTAQARAQVREARARAAHRLRDTPWRTNAQVSGAWLRDGPHAPPPVIRRPLDAALHRGALTLRGFDRALRTAWSIADIAARPQLSLDDIAHALYLKKGFAS
ncbi:YifB family Mg chelatase-like AAA ATPase [Microbacterium fluvii]|uniref:YifB family Mg chelatase-like AAA ATPase n=1 Tax=Microbacterium fluvii TaxID=415215 RepID=A0ABW2HCU4_9MICO|nr:YifB family Mg chelatase-like AAA ATPase [Microbacterium fluvii]MCU4672561.1 YifB family Mg chelatase-like AAA ATPase [Microbacterium fluvii]